MAESVDKTCGVCGDKAIARNFCAYSCESCKAFFRRNANNFEEMKCYFGDKCPMNVEMRTVCRKCRLRKCFAIGMRKEWILNADEKEKRRRKVLHNRQKRGKSDAINGSESDTTTTTATTTSANQPSIATQCVETLDLVHILEDKDISLEKLDLEIKQIESCLSDARPVADNSGQEVMQMSVTSMPKHIPNDTFTSMEGMKFTEVMAVTGLIRIQMADTSVQLYNELDVIKALMDKFDEGIREVVLAFKKFNPFQSLCKSDQISLFKSAATPMSVIRAVHCYDYESENLVIPLLTVIALFDSSGVDVVHRKNIRLQREIYKYLLQRYLKLKYGSEIEAKSKFTTLMKSMNESKRFCQQLMIYFLNALPSDVSPLLNEIFDRVPHDMHNQSMCLDLDSF
ncbi:unnamed protein product [Medioppia subpectinata]|uniref:Uncharacterized protein n=1 Tax=Medioppia subpectinata TaxID=1979941 RepID=A0A7R9PUJ9_9ACAR|nr:unnamed protein product [Medioppia subpectinata]CAG2101292.1 unnamed protein product [Medioppia subpectinata]